MNAVFDINRFINLEKRNLLNHKNHFYYVSFTIIGYFIFSVLLYFLTGIQLFMNTVYPFSLIFIACVSGFFEKGIRKENSTFDLILPASTFEKFLILIINYVIIIPLICFGSIFILALITGLLAGDKASIISETLSFSQNFTIRNFLGALGFQSIILVGYTYFKRFSFVKTILIIIGVSITVQILFTIIIMIIFGSPENMNTLLIKISETGTNGHEIIELCNKIKNIVKVVLTIIFPFGFWLVGFLKLREKEI